MRSLGTTVLRRKFCQIPPASSQNSTSHHGKIIQIPRLPFGHKLSYNLSEKLHFLEAGMVLSYASNIQKYYRSFFFSKVQFVNLLHCVYLRLCHITMVIISKDAVLGSLV